MIRESESLVDYIEMMKEWHHARNLIDGATDKDQVCKLIQEVGELSDNVCKGRDISDDIGDCIVVLVNIAERNGLSITECCEQAYNDIKDRRGKMVDGIFVKEEDDPWDNRTPDDDGDAYTTAEAEALGDGVGEDFAEMGFAIEKSTVTAKSRALKAEYTLELAQDLIELVADDEEEDDPWDNRTPDDAVSE